MRAILAVAGAVVLAAILTICSCTPSVSSLNPLPSNSRILEVRAGVYFTYYLDLDNEICVVDNTGAYQGGISIVHPGDCKRLIEKYGK